MLNRDYDSLDANARDLFSASLRWMEERWDESAGLLLGSGDTKLPQPYHTVRNSVWYAFGLFMRDRPADNVRAVRVIETVLSYQFDAPDREFHGTFYRAPEEPYPPPTALIWRDYDPNWREFIVTALALVLTEYSDRLPAVLVEKIDAAIRKAITGARARGLSAGYTNIALMYAFMLCFGGKRLNEPTWFQEGERMAREVYHLFKEHDAFAEYNSPTYYGVDVYALVLWCAYPTLSSLLAQLGREMETALWRDMAQFYHADLRNLAGPYDRSYGMDMRQYASVIGIWIRLVLDKDRAPFPNTDYPFDHDHDIAFVPLIAYLGADVPSDVQEHFRTFRGERQIERTISDVPSRVVTAWLGEDRMIGAEFTSLSEPQSNQLHPATIHWRIGSDQIGWVRLLYLEPVDAHASRNRIQITSHNEIAFLAHAPGALSEQIEFDSWRLPQLNVSVQTNAHSMKLEQREGMFEIRYQVATDQLITCTLNCE